MVRNCTTHSLWFYVGHRLRDRRTQMGLSDGTVAAHLGMSAQRYQQFEAGQVRIPAALLAQAGDLLKVPLFYFFHNLTCGEDDVEASGRELDAAFFVATDADRLDALVKDYMSLTPEGQSYLLQLAHALARDEANQ